MTPFTDDVAARLRAANPSPRYGAVVVDIADRDAALEEIARLKAALLDTASAHDEAAKWRSAASVLCGEHVGQKQDRCPVCEIARLRGEVERLERIRASLRNALGSTLRWVVDELSERLERDPWIKDEIGSDLRDFRVRLEEAEKLAALRSPPPPSGVVAETAVKARWIETDAEQLFQCSKCGQTRYEPAKAEHQRACWPQPEPRR
jgi:hypothetical protein